VSEVDERGKVLATFAPADITLVHLSSHGDGGVLVADQSNDRILLLSAGLRLERAVVDEHSQIRLQWPERLFYHELRAQLYVAHNSVNISRLSLQ